MSWNSEGRAGTVQLLVLSLMRIVIGLTFMCHGMQKFFGLFGGHPMQFGSLLWFAGVLEFFGGILIGLGLLTRPVAFLLSGQMAVAYFRAHAARGFLPLLNGGELAVLYCFVFLYLAAAGPGLFSLDTLLHRRRKAVAATQ